MRAPRYSRQEAAEVARRFFAYDYHDRGMLKWQGYFLSDHTSALNCQKGQRPEPQRPQLSETELGHRLQRAWEKKRPIHLQLNVLDSNHVAVGFDGTIAGYDETIVIIKGIDQRYHQVPIYQLRWLSQNKKRERSRQRLTHAN